MKLKICILAEKSVCARLSRMLPHVIFETIDFRSGDLSNLVKTDADLLMIDITAENKTQRFDLAEKTQKHLSLPIIFLVDRVDDFVWQHILKFQKYSIVLKPLDVLDLLRSLEIVRSRFYDASRIAGRNEQGFDLETKKEMILRAAAQSSDNIVITDPDGIIEFVNKGFEEKTGYCEKDVIGKNISIVKSGIHTDSFYHSFWQVLKEGKTYRGVFINKCLSGELYYEQKTVTPVFDTSGKVVHYISTGKDITHELMMEKEIKSKEEVYRLITENSKDIVLTVNRSGVIEYISPACKPILGFDAEILNKKNALDMVHPDDRLRLQSIFPKILSNSLNTIECRVKAVSQQWVWMEITVSTVLNQSPGNISRFVLVVRDISERRTQEERLSRLESLAAIGQASAMIAHEIRNPLAALRLNIEFFEKQIPQNSPSITLIKDCEYAIDRIDGVICEILEFSRPLQPLIKPCSLYDIVETALNSIKDSVYRKKVTIMKEIYPLKVFCDSKLMLQVFVNLITNAVESLGECGCLHLATREESQSFTLEITDNGTGISENDLNRIFKPFFTTKERGNGLGLAIVEKIVEAHKFPLKIKSRLGEGTTFFLQFPKNACLK